MLSLRLIWKTGCIVGSLLLTGCAQFGSDVKETATLQPPISNTQSDFDELLDFGSHMAGLTTSLRTEECRSLAKRQKEAPDIQIKLHLMVGRLLSDACGDIPKILDMIDSIPTEKLQDENLQRLIEIDTEVLKNIHNQSKRLGSAERKQKKGQTILEPKDTSSGSKKDENQLLREKLEAIRTMEKQLDESGEGK